jgi:IS30 family transposase
MRLGSSTAAARALGVNPSTISRAARRGALDVALWIEGGALGKMPIFDLDRIARPRARRQPRTIRGIVAKIAREVARG